MQRETGVEVPGRAVHRARDVADGLVGVPPGHVRGRRRDLRTRRRRRSRASDYRPSYLYWAAKAREKAGDTAGANGVLPAHRRRLRELVLRPAGGGAPGLAGPAGAGSARSAARSWPGLMRGTRRAADGGPHPLADRRGDVRLGAGRGAVRRAHARHLADAAGDARVRCSTAWAMLRPAINLMRQVYPQFLAAGGETLPAEILTGSSTRWTTGRSSASRPRPTSSTRTWWRR